MKNFKYILILIFILNNSCIDSNLDEFNNWSEYLGDKARTHYSSLNQINTSNVSDLEISWIYNSGDLDKDQKTHIQCSPIVVNGILYGTNPKIKLYAMYV